MDMLFWQLAFHHILSQGIYGPLFISCLHIWVLPGRVISKHVCSIFIFEIAFTRKPKQGNRQQVLVLTKHIYSTNTKH